MSMITELVKILKDLYVDPELDMLCGVDGECRQAIKESAQVIEELSAKLQSANMERSSQYYNGGWIPCSEKLPRPNTDVLTYRKDRAMPIFVDRYERYYGEDDGKYYEGWVYGVDSVTAWMPLPDAYKESEG